MGKLDARLEVRIDRPTLNRLERQAAREHTTVAALVRQAVRRFLETSTPASRLEAMEQAFGIAGPVPADPRELKMSLQQRFEEGSSPLPEPERGRQTGGDGPSAGGD